MAFYLVHARPKQDLLDELESRLASGEIRRLRPFGRALTVALRGGRIDAEGVAWWEEEDDCTPPLREERAAILDRYFEEIEVESVTPGDGWRRLLGMPHLFASSAEIEALQDAARDAFAWLREQRRLGSFDDS